MDPLRTIIVALDGSESSQRAAHLAARLAAACDARLVLFHTLDATPATTLGMRALDTPGFRARLAQDAAPVFEAVRSELEAGLRIELRTAFGDPADEIIVAAEGLDADLIVLGCRGQSPLRELILGSVSEKVIHTSERPVTVVH